MAQTAEAKSEKVLTWPRSTRDFDFFYKGLTEGKLLVQKPLKPAW